MLILHISTIENPQTKSQKFDQIVFIFGVYASIDPFLNMKNLLSGNIVSKEKVCLEK